MNPKDTNGVYGFGDSLLGTRAIGCKWLLSNSLSWMIVD